MSTWQNGPGAGYPQAPPGSHDYYLYQMSLVIAWNEKKKEKKKNSMLQDLDLSYRADKEFHLMETPRHHPDIHRTVKARFRRLRRHRRSIPVCTERRIREGPQVSRIPCRTTVRSKVSDSAMRRYDAGSSGRFYILLLLLLLPASFCILLILLLNSTEKCTRFSCVSCSSHCQ